MSTKWWFEIKVGVHYFLKAKADCTDERNTSLYVRDVIFSNINHHIHDIMALFLVLTENIHIITS